jgi:hypothetical protein
MRERNALPYKYYACERNKMPRKKVFYTALIILLVINIPLRAFFRLSPAACESYAANVHPVVVGIFAPISSLFPFSVIEVLLYIAAAAVLIIPAVLIIKKSRKGLIFFGKGLAIFALSCFAVFLFNSEINYNRQPFSRFSGIEIMPYTEAEILEAIEILSDRINAPEIADNIHTDENGVFKLTHTLSGVPDSGDPDSGDPDSSVPDNARAAMENLAKTYPVLDVYYPRPKPIAGSRFWLSTGLITGVYSPFTLEANYNNDAPESDIPHTVCHELSHLTGFMREDEANFIAYLACRESENADFAYSGCLSAITYLVNAYHKSVDSDTYSAMYQSLPEQVRRDFAADNAYWKPFRDTPRREVAEMANDTYLKVNGEADGVMSYGRCVDLIIAELIY